MKENILTLKDKKELKHISNIIKNKEEEILHIKKEIYDIKSKYLLKQCNLQIGDIVSFGGNDEYVITYAPWFGIETENSLNNLAIAPIRIKYNEADNRFLYLNTRRLKQVTKTYKTYKKKIFCYINRLYKYGDRRDIYGNICSRQIKR